MEDKLPGCGLRATPHIESRIKLLKKQYNVIAEMLGPNCSGFGWDDRNKCVTCDEKTFKEWVKVNWYSVMWLNFYMNILFHVVLHFV